MISTTQPPWASGPAEILKHGLELLRKDSDANRRLAMISIDNAVELTIKTYLGLPERITKLKISRNEYQEFAESFPKLLDALERYVKSKLDGIDLGEIEWYHRLRNQLYHQGNGLTVERDKVEIYAELANVLFANLFGFRLVEPQQDEAVLLGEFMQAWVRLEKTLSEAASVIGTNLGRDAHDTYRSGAVLQRSGYISDEEMSEIGQIRMLRNDVVHGRVSYQDVLNQEIIRRTKVLTTEIRKRISLKESNKKTST